MREHNSLLEKMRTEFFEQNNKLTEMMGSLENACLDIENEAERKEIKIEFLQQELIKEVNNKQEIEKQLSQQIKNYKFALQQHCISENKVNSLTMQVEELLNEFQFQLNKNEKEVEEKFGLQIEVQERTYEIIVLNDQIEKQLVEIQQMKGQIQQLNLKIIKNNEEFERIEKELKTCQERRTLGSEQICKLQKLHKQDIETYNNQNKFHNQMISQLKIEINQLQNTIQDLQNFHLKHNNELNENKKKIIKEQQDFIFQLKSNQLQLLDRSRVVEQLEGKTSVLIEQIGQIQERRKDENEIVIELKGKLQTVEQQKKDIENKFKQFKLNCLKKEKGQIKLIKKQFSCLKNDYHQFQYQINSLFQSVNEELQLIIISTQQNLSQLSVRQEEEIHYQRNDLQRQYEDQLNQQLGQEKERARVKIDSIKTKMGEEIVQLNAQIETMKKKVNLRKQSDVGSELIESKVWRQFNEQELFDIKSRYSNLKTDVDEILFDLKEKYQQIIQLHEDTVYSTNQLAQLKQFTDIQDLTAFLIYQLEEMLRKYQELEVSQEKEYKKSSEVVSSQVLLYRKQIQQAKQEKEDPSPKFTLKLQLQQYSEESPIFKKQEEQQESFQQEISSQIIQEEHSEQLQAENVMENLGEIIQDQHSELDDCIN